MKNKAIISLLALFAVSLAACGGHEAVKPSGAAAGQGAGQGAEASGAGQAGGAQGSALAGQQQQAPAVVLHTVHFAFDSSHIDSTNRAIVEANAAYMNANPQVTVTLQGNTDERGTREYNLALGERRAQSVKRMMRVLGVASDRMKTISFGAERPVALGHNRAAWRLNRRVDFVYSNNN
ncbi:MAG: peptidoglycan-associated lipoprotein Pal [Gammaproteobacteria bacterium]|nr:peptidoglycan-associated lipoprotein Pal [Gammaproteobacteria bacterium]